MRKRRSRCPVKVRRNRAVTDTDARCHIMSKSKLDPRLYVGALMLALALLGLMLNDLWPLWLVLLAAAMVLLTMSLVGQYEYQCLKCHGVYRLGLRGMLVSKHGRDKNGSWIITRCPHCGTVTKAMESRSYEKKKD